MSRNRIKEIGNNGEKQVSLVLSQLPPNNFKLYNNVLFKTKSGTTQIDHLLISRRGIFVIETKAYKGMIYGNSYTKYWTQCLFGRGRSIIKNTFYNPYFQNRGHLKNVMKILNTKSVCGVICFTSDNVDLSNVNCESVIKLNYLQSLISSIYNSTSFVDYNFFNMCNLVESNNIQSKYREKKHVTYVQSLSRR